MYIYLSIYIYIYRYRYRYIYIHTYLNTYILYYIAYLAEHTHIYIYIYIFCYIYRCGDASRTSLKGPSPGRRSLIAGAGLAPCSAVTRRYLWAGSTSDLPRGVAVTLSRACIAKCARTLREEQAYCKKRNRSHTNTRQAYSE